MTIAPGDDILAADVLGALATKVAINGGTLVNGVLSSPTITGGTFVGLVLEGPTIIGGEISGSTASDITITNSILNGGTITDAEISGGTINEAPLANLLLSYGMTAIGITSNNQIGSSPLPANAVILYAVFRETAGHSIDVSLGSTNGGSDVMSALAIPPNGTLTVGVSGLTNNWFSLTEAQDVYIASASWTGASVNVLLIYIAGP